MAVLLLKGYLSSLLLGSDFHLSGARRLQLLCNEEATWSLGEQCVATSGFLNSSVSGQKEIDPLRDRFTALG